MRDLKEKIKTSQNTFDLSSHYLITIDSTKQWINCNCTLVYTFDLTINPLNLFNFDFWFIHEIFYGRIKAKILSFNSLPIFPWVP
jgi:hypothetical protein